MKDRNLDIKAAAQLFGISPVTIQRWMHQGKIPFRLMGEKPFFKYHELRQWARAHDLTLNEMQETKKEKSIDGKLLSAAVELGGIYRSISGTDIWSAFDEALKVLPFITKDQKKKVHDQLLSREEMASTGIGGGIALPHSRDRMKLGLDRSRIALVYLKNSIDFNSVDGAPVDIFFMMFTTDTRSHLNMLSRISQILTIDEFKKILRNPKIPDPELLQAIAGFEGPA